MGGQGNLMMVRGVVLMAVLFSGSMALEAESMMAALQADGAKSTGRVDCASRRGLGECRKLGLDCVETPITANGAQAIQVEFPMLMHKVFFPCNDDQYFTNAPFVLTSIEGPNNNKLYASSLRNVTNEYFTVNVQRVDDVDDPEMTCSDYKICYVALVM